MLREKVLAAITNGSNNNVRLDSVNETRLTRAVGLAVLRCWAKTVSKSPARLALGWELRLREERRFGVRDRAASNLLCATPVQGSQPGLDVCTDSELIELSAAQVRIAHDIWTGWGEAVPRSDQSVHVYTDGSFVACDDPQRPSSSWAVVVRDRWLDDNFAGVPSDEQELARHTGHAGGVTRYGSSIAVTRGIYPAELQAIARALAMFPLSAKLHVHSDSESAIMAVRAFEGQCNERKRLRMAARPLLQLIYRLMTLRQSAGGSFEMTHVKAHTRSCNVDSVGNRLADFQANRARQHPDQPRPLRLGQLPLQDCEPHLSVWRPLDRSAEDPSTPRLMLIDDVRRTARVQVRSDALRRCSSRNGVDEQGFIIGHGCIDLGRVVLCHGSSEVQSCLVHVATNSIHFIEPADRGGPIRALCCDDLRCVKPGEPEPLRTLAHVAYCPGEQSRTFGKTLMGALYALIRMERAARHWCYVHPEGRMVLRSFILALFPLPAGASEAEERRHITRAMCGAFTDSQARSAARTLGLDPLEATDPKTDSFFVKFRLQCIEHIHAHFQDLKSHVA